ncbi:hypothetical protein [Nocardia sp. NPDC050710]
MGTIDGDKPLIESLWSRMQIQLHDRTKWKIRAELANADLRDFHNG